MFPVFDSGFLAATDALGNTVKFAGLQNTTVEMKRELVRASSQFQLPIKIAFGKGSIKCMAETAKINGAMVNSLYFGKAQSAGALKVKEQELWVVANTLTVTPPSGSFSLDLGVVGVTTGLPFILTTGTPAAGQYSVSGAVYTFNAADAGTQVYISYAYLTTGGVTLALTDDFMGVAPVFSAVLMGRWGCKEAVLQFNACASESLSLAIQNEDFAVSRFGFEVLSDSAGAMGSLSFAE